MLTPQPEEAALIQPARPGAWALTSTRRWNQADGLATRIIARRRYGSPAPDKPFALSLLVRKLVTAGSAVGVDRARDEAKDDNISTKGVTA